MSFVKEAVERTNRVAKKWTASGKRFGYPAADRYAKELEERGKSLLKKTGGK